jgi:hypothetical protein
VFSNAAAGIAAVSIGLNLSILFQGLTPSRERLISRLSMNKGCAHGLSRASIFWGIYPQCAAIAVDNAG